MLSDSESSGEEEAHQITVNEHYAKAYQARKEREELQKLKDKYGSDFDEEDASDESTDSESAESEDEDGEELTPAIDAAILRTLARIKRKDPSIYESGKDIYEEEQQRVTSVAQKKKIKDKSKPVTLRQVALEASLRAGSRSLSPEPIKPTHVAEQQALRDETIAVFHGALEKGSNESDDEDDGLLVPREKTKDELVREEEEYKTFLTKEVGSDLENLITIEKFDVDDDGETSDVEVGTKEKKKKKKRDKAKESKGNPKEQEDHKFLMDYILNRGWVDKSSRHIPTYNEVTSQKKVKFKSKSAAPDSSNHEVDDTYDAGVESDTSFESLVDHFEASYNFRFEEPGAETIQTFPRNLPNTVRRHESTRKDARSRRQERKLAELGQKREEVKRLKNLKMKEMRKKLERIGQEGGRGRNLDDDQALQQLDLDADWDPEAHEKQMAELYDNETEGMADDEKPTWDDDIDIGDIIPYEDQPTFAEPVNGKGDTKKKKKRKKKTYESDEDEGGVDVDEMDADVVRDNVEEGEEEEEWDGTEEMRKRKLKEYMAELDSLDFNDLVGGMPTRFRYVPVKEESFALTPVEILMATDKELNQYVGIKKYAPYKRGTKWDSQRNEKLRELKGAISERVARAGMVEGDKAGGRRSGGRTQEQLQKKRKGRKERMKKKAAAAVPQNAEGETNGEENKKRKRREIDGEVGGEPVSNADIEGEPSKKRKRRHRKKSEVNAAA